MIREQITIWRKSYFKINFNESLIQKMNKVSKSETINDQYRNNSIFSLNKKSKCTKYFPNTNT